jgi:hypothetical protein
MVYPGGSAPFNLTMLGEALQRRMVAAFAQFGLPNDNPDAALPVPDPDDPPVEPDLAILFDSVTVYLGSIKSRGRDASKAEVSPSFPLVLVKPRACVDDEGESGAQRTIVDVDFVIGTRRIGNDGYLDVTAVVERIRTNLLRDPIIENRARLELPLESEIGEDDNFPQWFGIVSAKFSLPQPVEETPSCA